MECSLISCLINDQILTAVYNCNACMKYVFSWTMWTGSWKYLRQEHKWNALDFRAIPPVKFSLSWFLLLLFWNRNYLQLGFTSTFGGAVLAQTVNVLKGKALCFLRKGTAPVLWYCTGACMLMAERKDPFFFNRQVEYSIVQILPLTTLTEGLL